MTSGWRMPTEGSVRERVCDKSEALPPWLALDPPSSDSNALNLAREELGDWEQQPEKRQHDENDLTNVIPAGRQVAHHVRRPEYRVVPEREEGPAFPAPERGHRDHHTEETHTDLAREEEAGVVVDFV